MKSSLRDISVITLIAAAFAAGCGKSTAESFCAKQNECTSLKDTTEAQCVSDVNKIETSLHNDPGCENTAAKIDPFAECLSALSCEELKGEKLVNGKCKQPAIELGAAYLLEAKTCSLKTPLPGAGIDISLSSTGTTEPSGAGGAGGASGAGGAGGAGGGK